VAIGDYAAPGTVGDRTQEPADWIGQDVVLPVFARQATVPANDIGPLRVGASGTTPAGRPAVRAWVRPVGIILAASTGCTADDRPAPAR